MRPHVIISSAMSLDGKIARADRKRLRLSNEEDLREVDRLRAECDAILVGSTTVSNDNPSLLIKDASLRRKRASEGKTENPMKVAISSRCDIPEDSRFFYGDAEKLVFTTSKASQEHIDTVAKHAEVIVSESEKVEVKSLLETLSKRGVRKLMVEGGGKTNAMFLSAGVVDEMRVAVAPIIIADKDAPGLADEKLDVRMELEEQRTLGNMMVLRYRL